MNWKTFAYTATTTNQPFSPNIEFHYTDQNPYEDIVGYHGDVIVADVPYIELSSERIEDEEKS